MWKEHCFIFGRNGMMLFLYIQCGKCYSNVYKVSLRGRDCEKEVSKYRKNCFYHNYGDRIALCVLESFKQPLLLGENKKEVDMATEKILSSVKNADRMECYTWVYRDLAEEELWDPQYDVKMVHDFEHQKFQTMKADKKEIIDYTKEDIEVYSRGIFSWFIFRTAGAAHSSSGSVAEI